MKKYRVNYRVGNKKFYEIVAAENKDEAMDEVFERLNDLQPKILSAVESPDSKFCTI